MALVATMGLLGAAVMILAMRVLFGSLIFVLAHRLGREGLVPAPGDVRVECRGTESAVPNGGERSTAEGP